MSLYKPDDMPFHLTPLFSKWTAEYIMSPEIYTYIVNLILIWYSH